MPDPLHWSIFLTATIILLLIPGPSVLYVISRGLESGYRGVVFSAIGLALGDLVQVLCVVMGISALLVGSPMMLSGLRYAGAAYLVALGLHRLAHIRTKVPHGPAADSSGNDTWHSLVLQGFFALNVKTAIFFLALFPQFVAKQAGPAWLQILLFGSAFVFLGLVTNSVYGLLGGALGAIGKQNPQLELATRCMTGVVFIGLGIGAVWIR